MNANPSDNNSREPDWPPSARPRPVVLLFLAGWGIAPAGEGNAIAASRTPGFSGLVKEYPVALLKPGAKTLNARYLSLDAGQDLADENFEPSVTLSAVLAEHDFRQIKIGETERFAALTHFFNGHRDAPATGEEWKIISSAGRTPLKSVTALNRTVREISKAVASEAPYDLIVGIIATLDLAAQTGDWELTKQAVKRVDKNLKKISRAVLDKGGVLIVTAASGNAERTLLGGTEAADKGITDNPVPLIVVGEQFKGKTIGLADAWNNDLSLLSPAGNLADLAPTLLDILGLDKPAAMTGRSLIDKK